MTRAPRQNTLRLFKSRHAIQARIYIPRHVGVIWTITTSNQKTYRVPVTPQQQEVVLAARERTHLYYNKFLAQGKPLSQLTQMLENILSTKTDRVSLAIFIDTLQWLATKKVI